MPISRRDILNRSSLTAVAGSVLRVIPMEAAEYAHRMVARKRRGPKIRLHPEILFARTRTRRCAVCATRSFRRTKTRKAQSRRERPNSST